MTAATLTLSDFLLARIAEDEAVARSVLNSHDPLPPWTFGDFGDTEAWAMGLGDGPSGYTSVIIDPARVLAECAAKRAIVEQHPWGEDDICTSNDAMGNLSPIDSCPVLRHLAAVYADHPDYRDEWRP